MGVLFLLQVYYMLLYWGEIYMARQSINLPDDLLEQAEALALANFQRPSGKGNFNELARYLLRMATMDPARFDLLAAAGEERATVNEEMSSTKL